MNRKGVLTRAASGITSGGMNGLAAPVYGRRCMVSFVPASAFPFLIVLGFVAMAVLGLWVNVGIFRRDRRKRLQRAGLWAPLASIVDGTVRDGTLIGAYRGYPVEARPVRDPLWRGGYCIDVHVSKDGFEWTLAAYGLGGGLRTPRAEWALKAGPAARRLTDAGLVHRISNEDFSGRPAWPIVKYERYRGLLTMVQVGEDDQWVPSVDAFRGDLDLLVDLADINQRANTR
jgi:hypothetical protein